MKNSSLNCWLSPLTFFHNFSFLFTFFPLFLLLPVLLLQIIIPRLSLSLFLSLLSLTPSLLLVLFFPFIFLLSPLFSSVNMNTIAKQWYMLLKWWDDQWSGSELIFTQGWIPWRGEDVNEARGDERQIIRQRGKERERKKRERTRT